MTLHVRHLILHVILCKITAKTQWLPCYSLLEAFSGFLPVIRNDPISCPDKTFRPELFHTASELRYRGLESNISVQRPWEKILARTFCYSSWKDHFLSLERSLKITLAYCSKDSLINYWFWQWFCTKWDVESNDGHAQPSWALEYINIHVRHISSALNLVSIGSGSPEIEITPNQVCDIDCDTCDVITHNRNCPPPLVTILVVPIVEFETCVKAAWRYAKWCRDTAEVFTWRESLRMFPFCLNIWQQNLDFWSPNCVSHN